jgi:predicted lipoprotein with Yx(FWY)xxD motif
VVKTATATVAGKAETILTDAQGKTLYYFKPDTATTVACTGGCTSNWPPLTFSGSGSPTGATSVPGKLAVLQGANGAQVTYNGHPLYTFAADTAPGQTNGQGKGGVWFVVTPDIATLS